MILKPKTGKFGRLKIVFRITSMERTPMLSAVVNATNGEMSVA